MQIIRDCEIKESTTHHGQIIENLVLENCTFEGGAGIELDSSKPDPARRAIIRNVSLKNTRVYSAEVEGAIIEDVAIDTTKGGKAPLFLRGNAYRHVTLRGRISHTEIRGKVFPSYWDFSEADQQRIMLEWDLANAKYYENVDWALDIREATYGSFSISGVPTSLIRRNKENTAVVTLDRARTGEWRSLPYKHGLFFTVISRLLDEAYPDCLLIACPRGSRYQDELDDLALLRDAGIAE